MVVWHVFQRETVLPQHIVLVVLDRLSVEIVCIEQGERQLQYALDVEFVSLASRILNDRV